MPGGDFISFQNMWLKEGEVQGDGAGLVIGILGRGGDHILSL